MMYEVTTCCAYARWLPIGRMLSLCSWNCFQHILLFPRLKTLVERCQTCPSNSTPEHDTMSAGV